MILLNNVIQIFTLTDFDAAIIIGIILIDTCFIGSTFVDINKSRFAISANGFFKETLCSLSITLGGKEKVYGVTLFA
tara:strand:+ start:121 stop:351 length:231 start_codon:yes stop_codon:yes gene_type:complete